MNRELKGMLSSYAKRTKEQAALVTSDSSLERATGIERALEHMRLCGVCTNIDICYELQPFALAPVYASIGVSL